MDEFAISSGTDDRVENHVNNEGVERVEIGSASNDIALVASNDVSDENVVDYTHLDLESRSQQHNLTMNTTFHIHSNSFTLGPRSVQNHCADIESLLRQWGASSSSLENDSSFQDLGNMEDGRGWALNERNLTYLFGDVNSTLTATALEGRTRSGDDQFYNRHSALNFDEASTSADECASGHRRVASAGGDRDPLCVAANNSLLLSSLNSEFQESAGNEIVDIIGEEGRSSAIHDAARITNWGLVAALSKSEPESAKYTGPDRWTALHHACSRRCPHAEVIDALLRAYPEALSLTDDRGWTPLHHACRFKAPKEVVRLLLRAYPELGKRAANIKCGAGRSALYYAIRYEAPNGVVELLLQADPSSVLDEDRDGVSPLGLVWDSYANSFSGKRDLKALLRKFESESCWEYDYDAIVLEQLAIAEKRAMEAMCSSTSVLQQLQLKWKIANNLLRAYFHFPLHNGDDDEDQDEHSSLTNIKSEGDGSLPEKSIQRKRKWRILHAVAAVRCHHTLFLLARALHPEQALELDENDLFGGDCDVNSSSKSSPLCFDKPKISSRTALHFAAMSPLSEKEGRHVIKTLLSLNPNAPKHIDGYGNLPLHLLALNDHKLHWVQDGVRDVYNAYREATSVRDEYGRTPLHCAASISGHYARSSSELSAITLRPHSPTIPTAPHIMDLARHTARDIGSVIQNLVIANRLAASIADTTGRLPLHYIAANAEEWNNDAKCILAAYPAASRARAASTVYKQLPLHMAASNPDARPSLIENIVNANPRAASLTDATGRLPLHLACDSGRTIWDQGIDAIFHAYTAAISTPEDSHRGWTVLHTAAASHSAGKDIIKNLLMLNSDAALTPDGDGRYPLHVACASGRHWDGGLQLIFDADPSVALIEDKLGMLPFHIVAIRSAADRSPEKYESRHCTFLNEGGDTVLNEHDCMEDVKCDLAVLEVLFNLLIAQPSALQ